MNIVLTNLHKSLFNYASRLVNNSALQVQQDGLSAEGRPPANVLHSMTFFVPLTLTLTQ